MKTTTILLMLLLALSVQANEVRTHYNVLHRDHTPAYSATLIADLTPSRAHRTYLLHAADGTELLVDFDQNYSASTTTATIEDPRTHDRATVTTRLPFKSKTVDGIREEARSHPELRQVPIPVAVHGNHGSNDVAGNESEWTGEHRKEMHESAKAAVGAALLHSLAKFQGLLGLPQFAPVCMQLSFIAEVPPCTRDTSVMAGVVEPDCEFDGRFGKACSASQLATARSRNRGAY